MLHATVSRELELTPFASEHVEAAGELFAARLDTLRDDVPGLESIPADRLVHLLVRLAEQGVGVAALADGRLTGYLAAFGFDGVRGPGMAAYVPEWGWAVSPNAAPNLLTRLYEGAGSAWSARGWLRHLITALPLGAPIDRQLTWLGFAPCVMDAFRPLDDVAPAAAATPTADASAWAPATQPEGVSIAPAAPGDIAGLADLARRLDDHLTSAPTFIYRDDVEDYRTDAAGLLADTRRRIFVARAGGEVVAYLSLADEGDGVAEIVSRPGIVHVVAAFTRREYRSRGVAEALLEAALSDAHGRGYSAAAVDFETANPLARRFWTRFFAPVCISYERVLDPRVGEADR